MSNPLTIYMHEQAIRIVVKHVSLGHLIYTRRLQASQNNTLFNEVEISAP